MSSHLSRKVSRKTTSTDATVEEVSRNKAKTLEEKLDRSTSYREAIEGSRTFSVNPPAIEDLARLQEEKAWKLDR